MAKKANNLKFFLAMVVFALCLFPGCKKEGQNKPVSPPKPVVHATHPVQKQVSSAKAEPVATQQFDALHMKNPFKPFIVELPKPAAGETQQIPGGLPIQNMDISSFKVAGIIVGAKGNYALLIGPAGKGYVVRPGMEIGSNDGRVTRITRSAVEVNEKYVQNGHARRRTVKLTLPQKKLGGL